MSNNNETMTDKTVEQREREFERLHNLAATVCFDIYKNHTWGELKNAPKEMRICWGIGRSLDNAELESTLEVYKDRVRQLEAKTKELKDVKLELKIARMLIDDDPAILELLEAKKERQREDVSYSQLSALQRSQMIAEASAARQGLGALRYPRFSEVIMFNRKLKEK